jgi:phosphoribosylglycinamide formyltransferase-1
MSSPTDRLTLGVLVSGRGSNLAAIVARIQSGACPARIGVVISNKKEAQALREAGEAPALFLDPADYPDRLTYDATLAERMKAHDVDLIVLAGYMRLITPALIEPYRGRILNVHPSLLPAFPGLRAQRQALEHGVKVSGCTVHVVDEEMDHGPIMAQAAVPVFPDDTEASLSERILKEEHRLLPEAIAAYANGVWAGRVSCTGGCT